MKFWQYVLGTVLAALIFAAAFLSENAGYSDYAALRAHQHLLAETKEFQGEHFTDTFYPNGEYARVFKGAKIALFPEKRELYSGEVFLGGAFFSDETVLEDEQTIFHREAFQARPNTILMGQALVHYKNSNVFLSRDESLQKTSVYAVGHSVDIWLESFSAPFVLPADTWITLSDSILMDFVENPEKPRSYAALRRDFVLTSFTLSAEDLGKNETPEQKVITALLRHKNWRQQFQSLAWDIPLQWDLAGSQSLLQQVDSFLRQNAFGVGEAKESREAFYELVQPLVKIRMMSEGMDEKNVLKNIEAFFLTQRSPAWKNILKKDGIEDDWKRFELAQKIWLPMTSPESNAFYFFTLWERPRITPIDRLEHQFTRAEVLAANHYEPATRKNLSTFATLWNETEFTAENSSRVTRLRRLVFELIRAQEFLQIDEYFRLWLSMSNTERMLLVEDSQRASEIALETGQDLLFFLKTLLHESDKSRLRELLIEHWKSLEIDSFPQEIQESFFSAEELDTQQEIEFVGDTGLTVEEMTEVKQTQSRQEALEKATASLQEDLLGEEDSTEATEKEDEGRLLNPKDLLDFFATQRVALELSSLKTTKEPFQTAFEGVTENGYAVVGLFEYDTQTFLSLEIAGDLEENLLPLFATKLIQGVLLLPLDSDTPSKEVFVPSVSQITPEAILARKFLQQLLASEGITASREQVFVEDEEGQTFFIQEANFEEMLSFEMAYDKSTETFSRVRWWKGDTPELKIPADGIFSMEELLKKLESLLLR